MTASIASARPATDREWDSCWADCDFATYFQSREWMELWLGLDDGRNRLEPQLITFSDGKRAIIPIYVRPIYKGLVRTKSLSVGGAYGGWLSTDPLDINHATALSDYILRLGDIEFLTNPCDPQVLRCDAISGRLVDTDIIQLSDGIDAVVKRWTKGHRSAMQKALRSGIMIRKARSIDDWRGYFEIYCDSIRRWGKSATSNHQFEVFEALFEMKSERVTLWLATHQEKIVAGAVCLYAKKHVSYWHGAALETYFQLRPVNLLLHTAIADACQRGIALFDLGLSGGHEGVLAFKRSFGAERTPIKYVAGSTAWCRMLGRAVGLKDILLRSRVDGSSENIAQTTPRDCA